MPIVLFVKVIFSNLKVKKKKTKHIVIILCGPPLQFQQIISHLVTFIYVLFLCVCDTVCAWQKSDSLSFLWLSRPIHYIFICLHTQQFIVYLFGSKGFWIWYFADQIFSLCSLIICRHQCCVTAAGFYLLWLLLLWPIPFKIQCQHDITI